jgi:hypothetical protein
VVVIPRLPQYNYMAIFDGEYINPWTLEPF